MKICNHKQSLAATVKELDATEAIEVGLGLVVSPCIAVCWGVDEVLNIEKHCSALLVWWLHQYMSEPETTQLMDLTQLSMRKAMVLH